MATEVPKSDLGSPLMCDWCCRTQHHSDGGGLQSTDVPRLLSENHPALDELDQNQSGTDREFMTNVCVVYVKEKTHVPILQCGALWLPLLAVWVITKTQSVKLQHTNMDECVPRAERRDLCLQCFSSIYSLLWHTQSPTSSSCLWCSNTESKHNVCLCVAVYFQCSIRGSTVPQTADRHTHVWTHALLAGGWVLVCKSDIRPWWSLAVLHLQQDSKRCVLRCNSLNVHKQRCLM